MSLKKKIFVNNRASSVSPFYNSGVESPVTPPSARSSQMIEFPSESDFPASPSESFEEIKVFKTGWLTKEGGKRRVWRRRWFILRTDGLFYFTTQQAKKCAGVVKFTDDITSSSISKLEEKNDKGRPFCFIIETTDRTYYLSGENDAEVDQWIQSINEVLTAKKKPVEEASQARVVPEKKQKQVIKVMDSKSLNEKEEFDVAVSAAAIFLKDSSEWTPEEQAYVLAVKQYRAELTEHMSKTSSTPHHGLSSGVCAFVVPPEERTEEENQFVKEVTTEYYKEVQLLDNTHGADSNGLSIQQQAEIAKAAAQIFSKPPSKRTPEEQEYVEHMEEYVQEVLKLELQLGVRACHDLASGTILLAKFPEERKQSDIEYIQTVSSF